MNLFENKKKILYLAFWQVDEKNYGKECKVNVQEIIIWADSFICMLSKCWSNISYIHFFLDVDSNGKTQALYSALWAENSLSKRIKDNGWKNQTCILCTFVSLEHHTLIHVYIIFTLFYYLKKHNYLRIFISCNIL